MKRRDSDRLEDIITSAAAIRSHLSQGSLHQGVVFDAVRMRITEIGEAVKALPLSLTNAEPGVQWSEIARMRDIVTHRYFDTAFSVVEGVVEHDLDPLEAAVRRMVAQVKE